MEWQGSEEDGISRRKLLVGGIGAVGLTVASSPLNFGAAARAAKVPLAKDGLFSHGVMSGMPTQRAITLWTRLSEIGRSSRLTLEVSRDKKFRKVVHRRTVLADAKRDYTVHALVRDLKPGTEYFYRFHTRNRNSRVGRFRTLPPADSHQPIRIAFFSCQNYEAGYFTAHAAMAKEKDLDLVVCLGDYIYEKHYWDGPAGRVDQTGVNHDGDAQLLSEYNEKYRLYQSDRHLADMHANHPFLSVWDDHEVEDNIAGTHPSSAVTDPDRFDNTDTPRRVPLLTRRANGYKAFFDHMPRTRNKKNHNMVFGSLRFGRTAELFLTDQRQYRSQQPCNDRILLACADDDNPARTMLGQNQKKWFKKAVSNSTSKWKLWGSEVMVMSLDLPKESHVNHDQWDGYGAERREILEHFRNNGVKNLAVLSGDIHSFFAGELSTRGNDTGLPIGTEFTGGSITSKGLPEETGISGEAMLSLMEENDPHFAWADPVNRGYGVVTCRQNELICEMKSPLTVDSPDSSARTLAKFRVKAGSTTVELI